jgi:hypothetical protein
METTTNDTIRALEADLNAKNATVAKLVRKAQRTGQLPTSVPGYLDAYNVARAAWRKYWDAVDASKTATT